MRCWRAKTDGWAASTFHSKCDGKGPTVTIIKVGSYIFGGYTGVSWSSKYQIMIALFSLSLLYYSGLFGLFLTRDACPQGSPCPFFFSSS